jgi:hypothetical protein
MPAGAPRRMTGSCQPSDCGRHPSILANFILLIMLIGTWTGRSAFGVGGANGGALLSAYTSLEQLDQAHIRTSIPVQTSIALDANVPVNSSTSITLAEEY